MDVLQLEVNADQEELDYFLYGLKRLTDREAEVARSILNCQSAKETARILGIKLKAVESYRRSIMAKVGAHRSADFIRLWAAVVFTDTTRRTLDRARPFKVTGQHRAPAELQRERRNALNSPA